MKYSHSINGILNTVLKNIKSHRKYQILLVYILVTAVLFFYNDLHRLLIGSADYWQFKQNESYSDPISYFLSFSLTQIGWFSIFTPLFSLIPLTAIYLSYRFFYRIIRFFTKETVTVFKYKLRYVFITFVVSCLLTGFIAYISFNQEFYGKPALLSSTLVLIIIFIVNLIQVIYLFAVLLIKLFRKITKKPQQKYSRKIAFGLAGINITGIVFVYFLISVIIGMFGLAPSNLSLPMLTGGGDIGFSTGGAKDINTFRDDIKNNYLPQPTDMTYEGLFYNYYFDTGQKRPCTDLFCPDYSFALSRDPFSQKPEDYMTVGLNSNIKKADFKRKKLNIVIVLDISGSMGSPFDTYYYDQFGNPQGQKTSPESNKTKMQIADEAVVSLLNHLSPEDRFGMVLFDENAYLAEPMRLVGNTDMVSLKQHILAIREQGSTNMEAGLELGTKLLKTFANADRNEYENRIIFLTDAQPNTGDYSENGLLTITKTNARNAFYTTFIGIGVDFNTDLIKTISKVEGSNYFAVHSPEEFTQRMDEGFDYMVTPLVFDLSLRLNAPNLKIEKVYGSPEADLSTNEIMHINTLFPSDKTDQGVKGGVVLLKLKRINIANTVNNVTIQVRYRDRENKEHVNNVSGIIGDKKPDYYENTGIRKAIILSRYANLLEDWLLDEENIKQANKKLIYIPSSSESGIIIPHEIQLTEWERQSTPLDVPAEYKQAFTHFRQYFLSEMRAIGDNSLQQEDSVLTALINK